MTAPVAVLALSLEELAALRVTVDKAVREVDEELAAGAVRRERLASWGAFRASLSTALRKIEHVAEAAGS